MTGGGHAPDCGTAFKRKNGRLSLSIYLVKFHILYFAKIFFVDINRIVLFDAMLHHRSECVKESKESLIAVEVLHGNYSRMPKHVSRLPELNDGVDV